MYYILRWLCIFFYFPFCLRPHMVRVSSAGSAPRHLAKLFHSGEKERCPPPPPTSVRACTSCSTRTPPPCTSCSTRASDQPFGSWRAGMPPKGDGAWVAGINDKGRFVVAKGADPAKPGQTAHQKVMKDNNIAVPLTQGKFAPTGPPLLPPPTSPALLVSRSIPPAAQGAR